jgi:hypothetical protein
LKSKAVELFECFTMKVFGVDADARETNWMKENTVEPLYNASTRRLSGVNFIEVVSYT